MNDITFSEAGEIMIWIGNQMVFDQVYAEAALDSGDKNDLIRHLVNSDIEEDRAVSLAEKVRLNELTGFDLIED